MSKTKEENGKKKVHSPVRNALLWLKTNFVACFIIAFCVVAALVTGIVINGKKGKTEKSYAPSERIISTSVSELKDLEVVFIDVGQGDCILVKFPDGKNMLIDGGRNFATVKTKIDEALTEGGKKLKIDYCVATHPDADHVGSLDYVYKNYEVGYSFRPYVKCETDDSYLSGFNTGVKLDCDDEYAAYLAAVKEEGTGYEFFTDLSDFTNEIVYNGKSYEYKVDFLMPYAKTTEGFKSFKDANDFSAIIRITCYGKSVLFCGDAETENIENLLMNSYKINLSELKTDVMKIAHHGGAYSTSPNFLNAVMPTYAVLSCGVANNYGHPARTTLNKLTTAGAKIYRTDLQGSATCCINAEGVIKFSVECDKNDEFLYADGETIKSNQYLINANKRGEED